MTVPDTSLALGSPRFQDASLAEIVRAQGKVAAWQAAFSKTSTRAAQGVSGDFAVALREPSGRVFMAVDRFAIHTLCYRVEGAEI